MPSWLINCGNATEGGGSVNAGDTAYMAAIGSMFDDTNENRVQILARDSYTLDNLFLNVITNTMDVITTFVSRVNGGNGNQSVSVGAATTGTFHDAAASDALVDGNLFNSKVSSPAGAGLINWTLISYRLTTVANTTPILSGGSYPNPINGGGTDYINFAGYTGQETGVESQTQCLFRVAAILSNFRVFINLNDLTGATTMRIRVDAADGNQLVSIGAGATGAFEDAVNTDVIASGNYVNIKVVTGANGGNNITICQSQCKSTSTSRNMISSDSGTVFFANNTTYYICVEGPCQNANATETKAQSLALTPFTAVNEFVRILNNSVNGATTFKLRKNALDCNLGISVAAGLTGVFEDLVSSDAIIATDLVDWEIACAGDAGTILVNHICFELQQPAAPPTGIADKSANMGSKMVAAGLI